MRFPKFHIYSTLKTTPEGVRAWIDCIGLDMYYHGWFYREQRAYVSDMVMHRGVALIIREPDFVR